NISLDESLDEKLKNDTEKVEKVFTDDTGDNIRIIVNTDRFEEYLMHDQNEFSSFLKRVEAKGLVYIDASDEKPMKGNNLVTNRRSSNGKKNFTSDRKGSPRKYMDAFFKNLQQTNIA
ncbi:22132_t:CDS:2, partial [Rhizophagus irregularis]